MKQILCENYEALSEAMAESMALAIEENPQLHLCLATGSSTQLAYEYLVNKIKERNLDVSQLLITKLDEWTHLSKQSELTCEYFIQERFIKPLGIQQHQFQGMNPESDDVEAECLKLAQRLKEKPIDLCILGFGKNGHLGLNEPDECFHLYAHVAKLSKLTQTHTMLQDHKMEQGMTIGMKEIMDSKKIIFAICGPQKEKAYQQLKQQEVTPLLPASILWLHSNTDCFIQNDQYEALM